MPTFSATKSTNADNAIVFEIFAGVCENFDTFQFGSGAGAMDVQVSGDGSTWFTSAEVAIIDMHSTTPSTLVLETAANKHYGLRGKWKGLRILQKGATAVTGAYLNAYQAGTP